MSTDTRSRMIDAAVRGLRHRGLAGMSLSDVLADSGAARGAIYHHFPGGKTELVSEATDRNGAEIAARFAELPATDVVGVVEAFLALVRPVLIESTGGSGCAVAAATVDGAPELTRTAARAFELWSTTLTARLTSAGLTTPEARDLAETLLAVLEGTQVLCRAAGNLEPFDRSVRSLTALVRDRYGTS